MSMFTNAKKVNTETKTAKGKKAKAEFTINSFANLARVKTAITTLEGLAKVFESEVKEHGFRVFATLGAKTGIRPENFRGVEDNASGSVELRKRDTRSALSDEEMKKLTDAGLPVQKEVLVNKMFGINPKYAENADLLAKVEAALQSIEGFPAEDFIVVQEEKSKNVVSDETITAAFKRLGAAQAKFEETKAPADQAAVTAAEEVVKMVTTMAVKPTTTENMETVMKFVTAMVLPKAAE